MAQFIRPRLPLAIIQKKSKEGIENMEFLYSVI